MQVWEIDSNNFYTGNSYFVEEPSKNEVSTPILIGYVKPKWDGIEWVEGATEEEIQEWNDRQLAEPSLPSLEERLQQAEDAILFLLMGGM